MRGLADAARVARHATAWASDIPALLFSGERDPVTPPEYGARVAKEPDSRAHHIVIRGGGHADQSPCKTQVIAAFLNDPSKGPPNAGCLDAPTFRTFLVRQ